MATQEIARTANGTLLASVALTLVGLVLLGGGGVLFLSDTPVAGYGIWVFVWGLAFLLGALSRYSQARV